jgi:hypothetical protein
LTKQTKWLWLYKHKIYSNNNGMTWRTIEVITSSSSSSSSDELTLWQQYNITLERSIQSNGGKSRLRFYQPSNYNIDSSVFAIQNIQVSNKCVIMSTRCVLLHICCCMLLK